MISFRKFNTNDMFSVIKLSSKTLTERYNPNLYNYFYESFPDGFWVCELGHKIIGFIVGIKLSEFTGKILMISVSDIHQNKDIGSGLLRNLLIEFVNQNIKKVELEGSVKNIKAIKFYKKHGFETIDLIENFYENNDNAYIMRLIL